MKALVYLGSRSSNEKLILISLIAFLNALVFIFIFQYRQPLDFDGHEYDAIGWNFAQGAGLIFEGQPYVVKPPTYHIFVGIIYFLFGHHPIIILLVQAILYGITCALIYFIAKKYFDEPSSLLASLLLAIYFPLANYASGVLPEVVAVLLSVLIVLFWIRYVQQNQRLDLFLCGLILGLIILCKPALFFLPLVIIVQFILQGAGIRRILFASGILFLGVAIPLSFWVQRNFSTFGEFILLSKGNMGSVVVRSVIDEDYRYGLWNDVHNWHNQNSQDPRLTLKREVERRIELASARNPSKSKDRLYLEETWRLIQDDPVTYVSGAFVRIFRLWIGHPTSSSFATKYFVAGFDAGVLMLAVIGGVANRSRWRELSVFWLPIVYITLIHLPMHVEPRYAAPMRPFLLIFSALGVMAISGWVRLRLQARLLSI